jgi:anti-anti-sigma regulatory factor
VEIIDANAELTASLPVVVEHQVLVDEIDAATVASLAGELDDLETTIARTVPATSSALVVLDLGRVRLLTASGLGCLLRFSRRLLDAGHRTIVANPSPLVTKVLAIDRTGLLEH